MGYSTRSKAGPPAAKEIEKKHASSKHAAAAAAVARPVKAVKAAAAKAAKAIKAGMPVKSADSRLAADVHVSAELGHFPDVAVLNDAGEEIKSGSVFAERGAVVFLYPKANTPGCTKQACGFRDDYSKFTDAGFAVYGLS
jgi:thioredoxin-dependent peroxiredoxin